MPVEWTNPFQRFIATANGLFRHIPRLSGIEQDAHLLARFVHISERRRFVFDICDRVETLAAALDRLRELKEIYVQCDKDRDDEIIKQRLADPTRVSFDLPGEIGDKSRRCHFEARALVAFLYYEMATIAALLRDWNSSLTPRPGSHFEYLIGVRNKLLVHTRRDGRIKTSGAALTLGPILHAHLVGADSWIPAIRSYYIDQLTHRGATLDDEAGEAANVALLRDPKKRTEQLNPDEKLRLKAYTIPEPDVLGAACELAQLLETQFLDEIEQACTASVT